MILLVDERNLSLPLPSPIFRVTRRIIRIRHSMSTRVHCVHKGLYRQSILSRETFSSLASAMCTDLFAATRSRLIEIAAYSTEQLIARAPSHARAPGRPRMSARMAVRYQVTVAPRYTGHAVSPLFSFFLPPPFPLSFLLFRSFPLSLSFSPLPLCNSSLSLSLSLSYTFSLSLTCPCPFIVT